MDAIKLKEKGIGAAKTASSITNPCQMTEEQINKSVDKALLQYKNREILTHDEFLKKHEKWL